MHFSILVDKDNWYLFTFTWEEWKYTWTVMSQGFTVSFSQTLKADSEDIEFSAGPILL